MWADLKALQSLRAGDVLLTDIRTLYPTTEAFKTGVIQLLFRGQVRLIGVDRLEVPRWQWRDVFNDPVIPVGVKLQITDQGAWAG
jgi:hypothetical protein